MSLTNHLLLAALRDAKVLLCVGLFSEDLTESQVQVHPIAVEDFDPEADW